MCWLTRAIGLLTLLLWSVYGQAYPPYTYDSDFLDMDPDSILEENAEITANATCGEYGREYYCRLVEHADGALMYRRPDRTKRQVMTYFQQEPRSYRDPSGHWVQCSFCDARNQSLSHPIEYVRSGESHLWWQSPSLAEGLQYHAVTITMDFKQVYQIVYVLLRMGDSPRPANWILERSLDGQNYKPWVFFAESEYDCKRLYEPLVEGPLTVTSGPRPWKLEDDEVYCTTYYSQPQALQSGEIIVTMSLDRVSTISTTLGLERAISPKLIDFLSARYVRLRFQKLQTLSGDWMAMPNQLDSSVYNRYYYSIRTIKVGGKCLCNSHANRCEQRVVDGVPRAVCVCQHNTCGSNCEVCCPMFNQQLWRPGRICEECNCHGKADSCVFNQTVANLRLSRRKDGVFEGGGVCVDCREDTTGINCESCKPGYYRPIHVRPESPFPCVKCECDLAGSTGVCVSNDAEVPNRYPGDCICKEGFAGKRCDKCAEGFRPSETDPSKCVPCICDVRGSYRGGGYRCDPPCNCKINVNPDSHCRECQPGYFNLDVNNPEGCQACYCSGLTHKCDGISQMTALTLEQNGLLGAVSTLNRWSILVPGASTDGGYPVAYREEMASEGESIPLFADIRIVESWLSSSSQRPVERGYYWSAPAEYLGKQIAAYRSQLTVILRFNSPTIQRFIGTATDPSRRISTSSLAIRDQLDAMWLNEPDIVIEGNGYRLAYVLPPDYRDNHLIMEVPLVETSFRVLVEPPSSVPLDRIPIDLSQGSFSSSMTAVVPYGGGDAMRLPGRPASIADMIAVLSKVDRFLIKAKYISDQTTVELRQVKLERAERDETGRIPSLEECICPVGHTGTSCESCAFGYWRSQDSNKTNEEPSLQGMWRSSPPMCVPCECHGHSAYCDEWTGKCTDCQHNTAGDKCEQCSPGFYGDPKSGSPSACQPCECPNLANKKTDSCVANENALSTDERPYVCLDCEDYTRGRYCELCAEGYYGEPEKGIPCRKCDCGRGAIGCNGTTGMCICGFNTAGPRCDTCAEGTHGDPMLGQACRPCNCNEMGSVSLTCRLGDGQCTCRPGYEGVRCERCVAGRGNVEAGCPPCQCSPLGTQQNVRPPCDQVTGQCVCKPGFGGTLDCSKCAPGYYNLGPDTCEECKCSNRAIDRVCDPEDGRCKCGENVLGNTCDRCKAGYFWNVTGPNCLACECGIGTVSDGTVGGATGCDMQTGQCRCAPHVTGRQCTECESGYFGVAPEGCQPCPSCPNGQVCDQVTGKCICPPNTKGDRCEECTGGSWDYNAMLGCKDCNCSEVGSVSGAATTCDLVTGKCACKSGFTGRACDECDTGYYGYPDCRPCQCDPAGSLRPNGTASTITLCDPIDGSCFCKVNVQGDRCDECKPGTFGLNIDYPLGCYTCFCFPTSQNPTCSQLTGYRSSRGREKGVEIISTDSESSPGGALIQLDIGLKDGGSSDLTIGMSQFNWRFSAHRPTFLEIPDLKGSLTRNYGSVIIEVLTECLPTGDCHLNPPEQSNGSPGNGVASGSNTDVAGSLIVHRPYRVDAKMTALGGKLQLEYQPADDAPSSLQDGYRQIWLRESDWVLTRVVDVDTRVRPTRNELMLALMNVTSFSVRLFMPEAIPKLVSVKYRIYQAMSEMKTSVGTPIRSIEQCECPPTSSGDHCEVASDGFYFPPLVPKPGSSILPPDPSAPSIQDPGNIKWTGGVEKCRCHGMSSHCDPITGICQACTGNTIGPDCGQCAEGYFGDPKKGQPCVKCQCPTEQTDYAITCIPFQDRPYVAHQCVCKPGYTGPRCERCAPGYFGDPLSMIACQPCDCDLAGSKSANCDQRTGACDCWPGIQGRRCDQCEPDHVVDGGQCRDCRGECTGELLIKADEVKAKIDNLNMTSLAYQGLERLGKQAETVRKRFSKERVKKEDELIKRAQSVAKQTGEIRELADRVMATRNAIEVARCSSKDNVTQLQKTVQRFEQRMREWIQRIQELSTQMPDDLVLQRWLEQARKVNTDLGNINLNSTQNWLDNLMKEMDEVISSAEQLMQSAKYNKTTADLERMTAYQSQQIKLLASQTKQLYEIGNATERANKRLMAAQEKSDALKKAATEAADLNVIQAFEESVEKLRKDLDQVSTIPPDELQSRLNEAKAALKMITGIDLSSLDSVYVPTNLVSGIVAPLEREAQRIVTTLRYSPKVNQTITALEAYETIVNNMNRAEEATAKAEEALKDSTTGGPTSWRETLEKIRQDGKTLNEALTVKETGIKSQNETLKEVTKQVDVSKNELDEVQKTADKTLSDAKTAIKNADSVKQLLADTEPVARNLSNRVEQQEMLMDRLQDRLKSAENRYAQLQGTAQSAVDQANGTQTSLVKAITEAENTIKQLDSKFLRLRRLADEARSMLDVSYGALAQDPVPLSLDRDCVYSLVPYSVTKSRVFDIEFWFRLQTSTNSSDGIMMVGRRAFIGRTQMFAFTMESAGKTLRFSWNVPNGKLELDSIKAETWYQVRVTSMWGETKMMLLERPDDVSTKPNYREVATNASAAYPESALMLDRQMEIRIGGANPSPPRLHNPESWGDNGAEVFWSRLLYMDAVQFCMFNLRLGATRLGLVDFAAASDSCEQPSKMVCQISNYRSVVRDGHIWRTQGNMNDVTTDPREPRKIPPNFVLQRMFFYDFAGTGGYARIQSLKDLRFCDDRLQFQVTPLQRAQHNKMMVLTFFNFDKDYGITVTLENGQPRATRWTGGQLYRSLHKAELMDMTEAYRRRVLRKSQNYKPRLRRQVASGANEEKREVSITQSEMTVHIWRLNDLLTTDCNDDTIMFVGAIPPGYYAMRKRMLELGLPLTPFAGRIGLTNDKPSQDGGLFLEEYTSTPVSRFGDTQFTDLTQRREAMSLSNVAPDAQYCLRLTSEWAQSNRQDGKELLSLNEKVLGSPWEPGLSMTVRFNPLIPPTENAYLLRLQLVNALWLTVWLTPDFRLGIGIPDADDKLVTVESLSNRPMQDPAFGLRELELMEARVANMSLPVWKESTGFSGSTKTMDSTTAETEVSISLYFNGPDSEQLDVLFDQRVVQSWTIPTQTKGGSIVSALVGPTYKYPISISYLTIGRHLVDFATELHTDQTAPGVHVGACAGQLYPRFVERPGSVSPVWIEQGLDLASPPGGRRLRLVELQPENYVVSADLTVPKTKPDELRQRREEDCVMNDSETAWFDQGPQSYWELTDLRTRVTSTDQPFEFTIGFRAQLSQGTRELQNSGVQAQKSSILAAFNFGPERGNIYLLVSSSQIFLADTNRLLWSSPHLTIADATWHRLQLTIPKNGDVQNGVQSGIRMVFDGRHLWLPRVASSGLPLLAYIGGLPSAWRMNFAPDDNIGPVGGLFGCVDEMAINGVQLPPTLSGRPKCYDCFSLDPNIYHVPATVESYLQEQLIPLTLPTGDQDATDDKLTFDFSFFYDREEPKINSLFILMFREDADSTREHRVWLYLTNNEVKMAFAQSSEDPQDQGHYVNLPNLPRSKNTWHFIKLEILSLGDTKIFILKSKGGQSLPLMVWQPSWSLKAIYFGQDKVIDPKVLGPRLHNTPGRPFVGCFRDIRFRTSKVVTAVRFPDNVPGLLEGVCHTSAVW